MAAKNVFVPALTEMQRRQLGTVQIPDGIELHGLLDYDTLVKADTFDFDRLVEQARAELRDFGGSIDAIIAHWDFPVSVLVPILAADYGLPAPSLTAIVRTEHKLWSRALQREVIPDYVPDFYGFDPFDPDALDTIGLDFPFFVKPIKSHSSQLGFEVHDRHDFADAVARIREQIGRLADPFDQVLARIDVPERLRLAGGRTCLAEQIITGTQAAPEGSMFQGRFHVHGVFDMRKDPAGHSFDHLDYPARTVPPEVQQRMIDATERYLRHTGFDNGCFNSEFMWNPDTDALWLIEVNTRISQSHSDLFAKVDGASNHQVAIDVALGRTPHMPHREGPFAVAAQAMVAHYRDGVVTRVPSAQDINIVLHHFPGTVVRLEVGVGDRLSELPNQDAYRYKLATVYLGADDHVDLERRYRHCLEMLRFDIDETDETGVSR